MLSSFQYYIFLAESFGFGPISSSITIARTIKMLDSQKVCLFLGDGTSYQLAIKSNVFDEIHFVDNISAYLINTCNDKINSKNCLVISNTYPKGVKAAKNVGFDCIFIDTLFWMWNELPIALSDVKAYYIEDFYCTDLKIDRFGYSNKFKVIPPLVDVNVAPKLIQHPFLLVSFGGIDSNLYDFPIFYLSLIEYIAKSEKMEKYKILVCGGGKKFRENEFKKYENDRLEIKCLSPHEYMSYLNAADLVLSSAGLHGFYENFFLRKNVMFLPPQSYSQYLQLKYILENFEGVIGANFENLGITHILRENMPELERIREVKRTNKLLVEKDTWGDFIDIFTKFHEGAISTHWLSNRVRPNSIDDSGSLVLAKEILSLN